MLLMLYLVLAVIPLLGIVAIVAQGSITTVDGLFMSLISAAMSAIFVLAAFFEFRSGPLRPAAQTGLRSSMATRITASGARRQQGLIQSVQFFESNIGEPNKSLVMLSEDGKSARMLVLEGDVRNALPVGKRVEITSREAAGRSVLLDVHYY
jgi:hypothetical protein